MYEHEWTQCALKAEQYQRDDQCQPVAGAVDTNLRNSEVRTDSDAVGVRIEEHADATGDQRDGVREHPLETLEVESEPAERSRETEGYGSCHRASNQLTNEYANHTSPETEHEKHARGCAHQRRDKSDDSEGCRSELD